MDNGLVLINFKHIIKWRQQVLILVVVDNGLVRYCNDTGRQRPAVLILVVVDNGLVHKLVDLETLEFYNVLILIVVDDGLVLDLIRHY